MPIRMPSTVSAERSRWLRTPLSPVRNVSSQLIARSPDTLVVLGDQAVTDADDPAGRRRHLDVVGDQHQGATGLVQLVHEAEHVGSRDGVEVAGRLVGQDQVGLGDQRPGHGDPLLLPTGELAGTVLHPAGQSHPAPARPWPAPCARLRCTPA